MTKRCTHCGELKQPEEFPPCKRMRDGRSSWCRSCKNAVSREGRRRKRARLPRPRCSECRRLIREGRRDRKTCSPACRDRRYARLHLDAIRAKGRRYQRRRKERS